MCPDANPPPDHFLLLSGHLSLEPQVCLQEARYHSLAGPRQGGADTDDAQEPPEEDDDEDAGPAEDDTGWEEEKLEEGQPHPSAGSEDADWEIQRLLAREGSPGPSGSSTVTETLTQASAEAPSALQPICPDWIEEYLRATDEDEM